MDPNSLQDSQRFELVWSLPHADLAAHLRPYVWQPTPTGWLYMLASGVALTLPMLKWWLSTVGWFDAFSYFCVGLTAGFLLLMPIHETVHAVAYRIAGAHTVKISYNWQQLMALCTADQFVVSARPFRWICLAPFLVINPPLLLATWYLSGLPGMLVAGALLVHVAACSGDIALVNWLHQYRGQAIVNYDDLQQSRTCFYRQLSTAAK